MIPQLRLKIVDANGINSYIFYENNFDEIKKMIKNKINRQIRYRYNLEEGYKFIVEVATEKKKVWLEPEYEDGYIIREGTYAYLRDWHILFELEQ